MPFSISLRPLARHINRTCGPFGARRLAGLKWFWMDGVCSQAQDSSSADYIPLFALAAVASAGSIGILAAAGNLVSIAGFLGGAGIAYRLRQRKPFILATGGGASRLLFLLLAASPLMACHGLMLVTLIIAINALRLMLGNLANPPWTAMAADLVPPEARGRYFASRNAGHGDRGPRDVTRVRAGVALSGLYALYTIVLRVLYDFLDVIAFAPGANAVGNNEFRSRTSGLLVPRDANTFKSAGDRA